MTYDRKIGRQIILENKIKVLQSVTALGIGGTEIFIMNFFRHMDKEQFQVDFVIYDDSRMNFYNEIVNAGSRVYICKRKYKNQYLHMISSMYQVRKILQNHSYNIIHCHACSFIGILRGAVPGFFTKNTKVISHAHNPGEPKHTKLDNMFRHMLKIIVSHISDMGFACSEICGESKYTEKFRKSTKYCIINNAIEIEKYQFNEKIRIEKRTLLGIENDFVIGSVGRLEEQKNYLFLIDVLEEYLKRNKQCRLLLVGEGSQREQIIERAKAAGIENHLIMAGETKHPEEYYAAMDVFVLPSIYEGFGLVNIEAQTSGLPCIVADVVPRDIDISGRAAFLPHDVLRWCEALDEVRKSNNCMGRESVYSDKYDIQKEVRRLESFYKNLST